MKRCAGSISSTSLSALSPSVSIWIEQRARLNAAGTLRGAFIGFGNVAANGHLPGWLARTDVEIVAASDATPGRRQAFLASCPTARWFDTAEALIAAGGVDFV